MRKTSPKHAASRLHCKRPEGLLAVLYMTRLAPIILALTLLTGCSAPQKPSDIADATQRAMSHLRVGMKETEAVALMRPVSLDSGRMYYGGSGAGRLYFQIGSTRQLWLESGGSRSGWTVTQIGLHEPKTKWTHYSGDSITVE